MGPCSGIFPYTNTSTPALFGGYEYMPNHVDERIDETLCEKQNEALSVLPVIFNNEDFDVTVCDPLYAGAYEWTPDVSIYDEYENIDAYVTEGAYSSDYDTIYQVKLNKAFFKSYSVMTKLINLSGIQEEGSTFLMMQNSLTHEPAYLSVPDYEPNAELTGKQETTAVPHYMVNMAAFMKLTDWFNWMR